MYKGWCSLCITKEIINVCLLVVVETICLLLISLFNITQNLDACRKFFYDIKWPTGYYCEKCGCTHYYFMKNKNCYRCANCKHDERLLSNTIFQDNKLPLNVLLYGLFLIFTANNGISSMELSKELKVITKQPAYYRLKLVYL